MDGIMLLLGINWGQIWKSLALGKNGHRVYGSSSHKPLCWPDTLSFEAFKGPNYATIKEANLILESILDELNDIDIHEQWTPTKQAR